MDINLKESLHGISEIDVQIIEIVDYKNHPHVLCIITYIT